MNEDRFFLLGLTAEDQKDWRRDKTTFWALGVGFVKEENGT